MKGKHFKNKNEKKDEHSNKKRKYIKRNKYNNKKYENNKKHINSKMILRKVVQVISILVFFVCLAITLFWMYSNVQLKKIENDLSTVVTNIQEDNLKENKELIEKGSLKIDFTQLKSINSDVIGWIYIKDTDINYPILQTTNNEYYLKNSLYKTYSSCGSIFLDCNTKKDFSEQNTVIYGHNLKNQKMFADLEKVYKGELGDKITIEIYTEEAFKKYMVFASYMEEPNLKVIQKNWNQEQKTNFIESAIKKSSIKFSYDMENNKNILTLITCDSTGKKRIIVHAINTD